MVHTHFVKKKKKTTMSPTVGDLLRSPTGDRAVNMTLT
jgi:hypothetical protein